MKETQPIFPIEDTVVNTVQEDKKIVNDEIRSEFLVKIAEEKHPELVEYFANTVKASPELFDGYVAGFRTMYDVIRLSSNIPTELTREDMIVHGYNVQEYGIDRLSVGALEYWCEQSSTNKSTKEQSPVSTFMDRLESSSQLMYSDVRETLAQNNRDANGKIGYFRGLYDVFMPFYNKAEAEHLEAQLITLPKLKKAVNAGYYSTDTLFENGNS